MIVACYGGPKDGQVETIAEGYRPGSVLQFARALVIKSPNASAYSEYTLSKCGKKLVFKGYSKIKFGELR